MDLNLYTINHINNSLELFSANKEPKYSAEWYMDFGKFGSEIFDQEKKILYKITKRFQFWKWRMLFEIQKNNESSSELISQNNRKTVYAVDVNQENYEVKIHYKKRLSVFKNSIKIAEFDESYSDEKYQNRIKLLLLDNNDLEICFLIFACLKIGEQGGDKKPVFTSQKQLEVNTDPWS